MPNPRPIPTNISTILALIRAKLVADAVGTADQIDFTLSRSPKTLPHLMNSHDIWLWPRDERFEEGFFEGGGRTSVRVIRKLFVVVRTQLNLDHAESDRLLLTDATLGHAAIEDAVVQSLHDFYVADASGNRLTTYGIEVKNLEGPERVEDRGEERGWCSSAIVAEVPYVRVMSSRLNPSTDIG